MWVCPNCETANISRKRKCAVCDEEQPFSHENPNSSSILKNKILELELQNLLLNQEIASYKLTNKNLNSEIIIIKSGLKSLTDERDNIQRKLSHAISEKSSYELNIKKLENDKLIISSSLFKTKNELQAQLDNSKSQYLQFKKNTAILGIIIVVLSVGWIISVVSFNRNVSLPELNKNVVTQFDSNFIALRNEANQFLDENNLLVTKLEGISREFPFLISSIDFENTAEKSVYKKDFNYYNVKYISPRLKVILISNSWRGKISVKYFDPHGTLKANPAVSPINFTFYDDITISPNQEYIYLSGWGSDIGTAYEVGIHTAEIWYNDKIIGKQTFTVSY